MKFAAFFMGEYIAILAISGIMATCFLGGYLAPINVCLPFRRWQGRQAGSGACWQPLRARWRRHFWFVAKVFGLFFVFLWVRATLLRLRL